MAFATIVIVSFIIIVLLGLLFKSLLQPLRDGETKKGRRR